MSIKITAEVDVIGVGLGPFNLGLAALLEPVTTISSLFFETKEIFSWHSGLLLEDCTLQVPMMADLVTMADPTSKYSYLNYLHETGRLYNFYFYENFMVPRVDYNAYCQWVSHQLNGLLFSKKVIDISQHSDNGYLVTVLNLENKEHEHYHSQHIVLGVGSSPSWPTHLQTLKSHQDVIHSSDYLPNKDNLKKGKSITIVGSGQSAAEIVLDLLNEQKNDNYEINWLTRSDGFLPMEYSKLGLEHFSPDYIDYFHQLPEHKRDAIRQKQDLLYKGISQFTIGEIYDRLYKRSIDKKPVAVTLQARSELISVKPNHHELEAIGLQLEFKHLDQNKKFNVATDKLILATGHAQSSYRFLSSLQNIMVKDSCQRPVIDRDYSIKLINQSNSSIFVQNGDIHSHGIGAPDLGLGAYRSAAIINNIADKNIYKISSKNVFQNFGIAEKWEKNTSSTLHSTAFNRSAVNSH